MTFRKRLSLCTFESARLLWTADIFEILGELEEMVFRTFARDNFRGREVWWVSLISDVEDVKFVINFDYPSCSEDYVHRIGRTGRRQKTGTAYTFFTPSNSNKANDLIQVLKEANQVINPKLLDLVNSRGNAFGRGRGELRSKYVGSFVFSGSQLFLVCNTL